MAILLKASNAMERWGPPTPWASAGWPITFLRTKRAMAAGRASHVPGLWWNQKIVVLCEAMVLCDKTMWNINKQTSWTLIYLPSVKKMKNVTPSRMNQMINKSLRDQFRPGEGAGGGLSRQLKDGLQYLGQVGAFAFCFFFEVGGCGVLWGKTGNSG